MKNVIPLYHPNGTFHRGVSVRILPQRRTLKLVRVARVDGYVLGVSARGTVYSVDSVTPRSLSRGNHMDRCLVKCLEMLGVITPAELEATLAKIEKVRVERAKSNHRYDLAHSADALGITLNKTQKRKAGLL